MTIQVHEPHPGRLHGHSQRRRHLSRSRLVLASVTLLLVVGIALVVLTILQFIQGPWILLIPVVFTGFGLVFTSLQWLFPVDPIDIEPHLDHRPVLCRCVGRRHTRSRRVGGPCAVPDRIGPQARADSG